MWTFLQVSLHILVAEFDTFVSICNETVI